ncbi:hypothetical protein PIB30_081780 [Stylosanthes scabra]|uniref:Uncharacterized protein n=1 Tax=Stylosanthes scabra TaxID=79078 RepID=A0ABU6TSF5_9FABA|nr:hypothetical protein [Stylosanthes scabra]
MGKKSVAKKVKAVAKPAKKKSSGKNIYDRYDIYDNTIYSDAAAVNTTTEKIGHALGLTSKGTPYDIKVDKKKLSQEDSDVHKFFQGITTIALQNLIKTAPIDTDENMKLWMRSFILFVQQVFLLSNSTAKITPVALPIIFDLENTRNRNWAHHVHNFLLQELKKVKQKKSVAIHGCCYALMIIYFHETQFGEKSRDPAAQPPWLAYWTSKMRAEKEQLKKKSTKRVLSSDSESQTYSESQNSSSTESQQQERRSKKKEDRRMASSSSSDSEETISKEPPQQEIRIKQRNDRAVVGSNAPFNPTQQSAAVAGLPQSDDATLADALKNIRKRNKQQIEDKNTKKRIIQGNEGGEKIQDVKRTASEAANRPLHPDQPFKPQYAEVEDPVPINIEIPLETQEHCSLTLRPWLQPEAETSTAVEFPEAVITNVLLGMNREESNLGGDQIQPAHDDNQEQQLEAQCKTPDLLQQQY